MTGRERDIFEATASAAELAAHYAHSIPVRRRWRLEGTLAGNSRLVTRALAERLRSRYGGGIVQVFELRPLCERQALALPECPVCTVAAGEPCISKLGNPRRPHARRWEVSE